MTLVGIAILTPAIVRDLEHLTNSKSYFSGLTKGYVDAGIYNVLLEAPGNPDGIRDRAIDELTQDCSLVIAGGTFMGEKEVFALSDQKVPIARYSVFYGERCQYNRRLIEETGYSFDIPYDLESLRKMLTNEEVIDGLVRRDEDMIKTAVSSLNRLLDEPIIITPLLTKILNAT